MIGRWQSLLFAAVATASWVLVGSPTSGAVQSKEAEVLEAESHYDHGTLTKDLAELDATWAETFIDTSGPTVRNKREMLDVVKNGPKLDSLRIDGFRSMGIHPL
jgi:hypothetical protein